MEDIVNILGILGTYFAIVLVLAVSVETILDLFKMGKYLQKRVNPEQALQAAAEWTKDDEKAKYNTASIANLVKELDVNTTEIEDRVSELSDLADSILPSLGLTDDVKKVETKLAVTIAAIRKKFLEDEAKRIRTIRIISALIGISIALLLKINTFDYLSLLLPENIQAFVSTTYGQIGGMILTGFAASAGSSFWHDQLGNVRSLKETTQSLKK